MGRGGPGDAGLPPSNEQDLYEPTKPQSKKVNQPQSPHAPSNEAQPFPPPPPHHQAQYDNNNNMPPQAFPPPPPPQVGTVQSFPPPAQNPPINHHPNNVQFQQQPGFSQPPIGGVQMGQPQFQHWSSGLFDCMNDPGNAIITACFPCVTFGQIAEIVDSGGTSCGTSGMLYGFIGYCIAVPCIISCSYRTKMRSRFGLSETPAPDWVVHCFCECCALCQEYRELTARDLDPSIGWMGNVAKQRQNQQFASYGSAWAAKDDVMNSESSNCQIVKFRLPIFCLTFRIMDFYIRF